jgi:hypothetical protein
VGGFFRRASEQLQNMLSQQTQDACDLTPFWVRVSGNILTESELYLHDMEVLTEASKMSVKRFKFEFRQDYLGGD